MGKLRVKKMTEDKRTFSVEMTGDPIGENQDPVDTPLEKKTTEDERTFSAEMTGDPIGENQDLVDTTRKKTVEERVKLLSAYFGESLDDIARKKEICEKFERYLRDD